MAGKSENGEIKVRPEPGGFKAAENGGKPFRGIGLENQTDPKTAV